MNWKLTLTAIDEQGYHEAVYTSDDGLESPEFARGFALGYAAAHGVKPDMVSTTLEWL